MASGSLTKTGATGLMDVLSDSHHAFLQPSRQLYDSALQEARSYIDPLASAISAAQQEREKQYYAEKKKRKRGDYECAPAPQDVLRMKRIHVDGFDVEQIWGQAQRVLKAAADECEREIEILEMASEELDEPFNDSEDDEDMFDDALENGIEGHSEEFSDDLAEDADSETGDEELDEAEDDYMEEDASVEGGEDEHMGRFEDEAEEEAEGSDADDANGYEEDPDGLNDGFFSLENFNRTSAFLERQDARGDPDDGAASDEEEIDWAADPLAQPLPKQGNAEEDDAEDGDDDSEDGGPTFGNVDLDAPEGASEDEEDDAVKQDEMEGMDDLSNTNNIMYSDFFAPPPKKSKNKRGRPHPHNFPAKTQKEKGAEKEDAGDDEHEADINRAMSSVHRDLFSDSEEGSDAEDAKELDTGDPISRRSTHERRQAQILAEIRKLEAENVASRSWQLSGEASAGARPMNSLLEEDLEFERAGKPVPVVTAGTTEDIEALIKRRILAKEFDEVIRRRPEDMMGPPVRRGRLEDVEQTKDKKGLGELYEEDHLRRTDPNFVEAKDESLQKQHVEIQSLWRDICSKLDSLSSWHYRPKAPEPQLEVRVDAPTISMEDARPTGEVGSSMLAPQEIYKVGEGAKDVKGSGEVATRGGMPVVKGEMSREEKRRRRRREKERAKKSGTNAMVNTKTKAKKDKEGEMLGTLKQAGVRVIDKKGELRDVTGKVVTEDVKRPNPSNWRL